MDIDVYIYMYISIREYGGLFFLSVAPIVTEDAKDECFRYQTRGDFRIFRCGKLSRDFSWTQMNEASEIYIVYLFFFF